MFFSLNVYAFTQPYVYTGTSLHPLHNHMYIQAHPLIPCTSFAQPYVMYTQAHPLNIYTTICIHGHSPSSFTQPYVYTGTPPHHLRNHVYTQAHPLNIYTTICIHGHSPSSFTQPYVYTGTSPHPLHNHMYTQAHPLIIICSHV